LVTRRWPCSALEASERLAMEHDLAMLKAWSMGIIGWCAAENCEPERGAVLLTKRSPSLNVARHSMPYLLGLLAQAHIKAGNNADAMKAVEEGIALAETGGERFYSAELYRLKGSSLLNRRATAAAKQKSRFMLQVQLAKKRGATALENAARASLRRWSA
jgi:predicted ATPase